MMKKRMPEKMRRKMGDNINMHIELFHPDLLKIAGELHISLLHTYYTQNTVQYDV